MRGLLAPALVATPVVALIVALGGCASAGGPRGPTAWAISEGADGELTLAEGVSPGPARFWMTCRPGTGALTLTVDGRPGDPAVIELRSGKLTHRYGGAGHADAETGGALFIDFPLKASDPVLGRAADTGELTLVFNGKTKLLPNGFAPTHDFIVACRASSGD